MNDFKIAFLGGGNMGEALIKGLLGSSITKPSNIIVSDIDTKRLAFLKNTYGVGITDYCVTAVKQAEIIFLAVKPNIIKEVLYDIHSYCDDSKLIISIAAGVTISAISSSLLEKSKIVRVMPNTPALLGEGISAISYSAKVEKEERELIQNIFNSVGKTVVLEENMMDAVTGLSGSGPAFIFLIIEALADGGVKMGLPRTTSLLLAAQTVKGAAEMVLKTGKHTGELKDMVTSPGGTTISGIHALEKGKIKSVIMDAVEAATKRSIELGCKQKQSE